MQRRLRNVHKSVMHVRSCFSDINHLLFPISLCRSRRRCLSPLLLWSRNWASMVTWRYTSLYRAFSHDVTWGLPKQGNGGHVGVPRQPCGNWTLFLCKNFLFFQWISIDAGHLSENALLTFCLWRWYCLVNLLWEGKRCWDRHLVHVFMNWIKEND